MPPGAVSLDREAAAIAGIRPDRMNMLAFALGGMIAGLSKMLATEVYEMLTALAVRDKLTILIVDQEIRQALKIADYVYVLELGRNKLEGPADEFDDLEKAFLVG